MKVENDLFIDRADIIAVYDSILLEDIGNVNRLKNIILGTTNPPEDPILKELTLNALMFKLGILHANRANQADKKKAVCM